LKPHSKFVSLVLRRHFFKWSLWKSDDRFGLPMDYSMDRLVPMTRMINDACDGWRYDENDQNPQRHGAPGIPTRTAPSGAIDGKHDQYGENEHGDRADSSILDGFAAKDRIKVRKIALAHADRLAKG
jgi:hypothetical protein